MTELRNGALNHRTVSAPLPGTTTFTLTRPQLIGLVTGSLDPVAALSDGSVVVDGDAGQLVGLVGFIAPVDPAFPIVTP